jgi:predicted 3-demethylubiquinone-9 3-methyltransferase (glyoxalase superfamily)
MQKITPFLWFDTQAEEAVNFYVSIFKNSKILNLTRYGEAGPREKGLVMTIKFELEGQEFAALNGGPEFTFNPAISLFVDCVDQSEVDGLWDKLIEGGKSLHCGWVQDKFGLCWQVVPRILVDLLSNTEGAPNQRVMEAMFQMDKIDGDVLAKAAAGN